MAPGLAATANMMSNNVFEQIADSSGGISASEIDGGGGDGGSGGGHHHHHHHSGTDHDFAFGNGTNLTGTHGHQSHLLAILSETSAQHRMGVIITLAFSIMAALIVIYTIVHDAYRVRPGEVYSRAQKQSSIFKTLHAAEVFPFIVSIAILIQGFIFLGVQAGGIDTFEVTGCRLTSELIWPAFFLVIFIILTFSCETALRGLSKRPFRPRGKFTTPICIATVFLLLLGLWLSAYFFPSLDICPAALAWWTVHYSKVGIAICGGVIAMHFIAATAITFQLMSTVDIDGDERIAASRVVYTMVINVAIIALLLPFWLQIVLGQFPIESSEVADIGITLTGMVFGAMHLFSRANAERLAIRPKNMPWSKNKSFRLFGSSDLHERTYISAPLLEPKLSIRSQEIFAPRQESLTPNEPPPDYPDPINLSPVMPRDFTAAASPTPLLSQPQNFERPLPPQPVQLPPIQTTHAGYTTEAHRGTPVMTPNHSRPTTEESIVDGYAEPSSVEPPVPLFAMRHERQDSNSTSGSIEIGLRLSRPITGMQTSRGVSNISDGGIVGTGNVDKSLPSTPVDEAFLKPAVMTPSAAKKGPIPPPSKNVGIGALGHGPKGGLKAMTQQTQRTSPLANVMKVDSPTPSERSNPFSPPAGAPPNNSPLRSGSSQRSPHHLSPPTVNGLPRSPSPRARSPAQQLPQRSVRSESVFSGPESPAHKSPTEWPQWGFGPQEWPSGDQVDMPSPRERRWA